MQCGDSKNTQGSPNILQLNCLESTFVALTIFKVDLIRLRYVALDYIVSFFALRLLSGPGHTVLQHNRLLKDSLTVGIRVVQSRERA